MARARSLHPRWLPLAILVVVLCASPALAQMEGDYLTLLDGYRDLDGGKVRQLELFWEEIETRKSLLLDTLRTKVPLQLAPLSQMALFDLALEAFARDDRYRGNRHPQVAERWIDLELQDPKPPLSYLAALFSGQVEERRAHADTAMFWYRTAIATCPLAQTARLALSHARLDDLLETMRREVRAVAEGSQP